ncbi:hypothetical protein B0H13DRAFT_2340310 [Mycena leptocephala]|nr:hypothetical protein B0H13DRAFT_2340310 [Mycena leptocephala]
MDGCPMQGDWDGDWSMEHGTLRACCVAGLDSPLLGVVDANPVVLLFHPLVAATASSALVPPQWSSTPVSPSPPPILVVLMTPGRYYNLTTYDIQRHAVYTSFDAHALWTTGHSADLADSLCIPFCGHASMPVIDSKITFLELRALPTRSSPPALQPPLFPSAARVPTQTSNDPLATLTWATQIHPQRLLVPPVFLHLTQMSAKSIFLVFWARMLTSPPRPHTRFCTHDYHESAAYSLWASQHYAAVYPYPVRIPRYLRSNLHGTNNVDCYPLHYLRRPGAISMPSPSSHTKSHGPRRSIGPPKVYTRRALFLAVINIPTSQRRRDDFMDWTTLFLPIESPWNPNQRV